jgi:hypothetical protein
MNTGQIQMSQPFGQWIAKVSADPRFTRYLEIGTWNGRGSTYCIYQGFKGRTDSPVLQSYEINTERIAEAKSIWASVPWIKILYGRVLRNEQCPTYREVSQRFPNANASWHAEDVKNFWDSPYIAPEDPEVVLLDGAEYLTWYEFDRVFKDMASVQVFLLDDTKTDKTPAIAAYLSAHPDWVQIAGSDTERNGWAIFERRPPPPPEDQTEGTE